MSYLDTDRPVLYAGYLQHPVFTENFDIYVVGGKKLNPKRLSGSLTIGDAVQVLDLKQSGQTGRVFVDNNVTITQNGVISLQFGGTNEFGFIEADTVMQFSVSGIEAKTSGMISNPEGTHTLTVPASAVPVKTTFSAKDGMVFRLEDYEDPALMGDEKSIPVGTATAFGPPGVSGTGFALRFRYTDEQLNGREPAFLRICRYDGTQWAPLPGSVNAGLHEVAATTDQLGSFQIRWNPEYAVLQPIVYMLEQNYPNPFNSHTTITFSVRHNEQVTVTVYDILGREVRTLAGSRYTMGTHTVIWDGNNHFGLPVSSGVYFYTIKAGAYENVKKMLLIR